jgi:Trp operon repressor
MKTKTLVLNEDEVKLILEAFLFSENEVEKNFTRVKIYDKIKNTKWDQTRIKK